LKARSLSLRVQGFADRGEAPSKTRRAADVAPRPGAVAIRRHDGGAVGSAAVARVRAHLPRRDFV
jgi:hypothetical protein